MKEELQESSTGASFHGVTDWHAIDWKSASCNVRRLQTRIVKATQEKRWGKVKALQRLLTHLFSGKALAVRRVTENQGKNTDIVSLSKGGVCGAQKGDREKPPTTNRGSRKYGDGELANRELPLPRFGFQTLPPDEIWCERLELAPFS